MKSFYFIPLFLILFYSCRQKTKDTPELKNPASVNLPNSSSSKSTNWYDALLVDYIKHSDNKLIKLEHKKDIQWVLDNIKNTDSAKYFIFNIGVEAYDVNNGDTCCYRFSSCAWVYIDSLTKKMYEYNVENDTLIRWKPK